MSQTSAEIIKRYTPTPPRQVLEASASVDAMIAAQKNPPPAQPAGEPPAQPPAPPAQAAPPVQPATPQAPTQPPPAPAAPAAQPPAGGDVPPAGEDTWEARARSAQGRYENIAKVNNGLTERLGQLETLIATMQMAPPAAAPTPAAPVKLVTPEEETEFGTEFLDVAGRRAKEVITPELSALALRLGTLENQIKGVATVTQQTAKERLYSALDTQVEHWRQINNSPEFKTWLAYPDPYSGRVRKDMLLEAFAGHDAVRVVRFFTGFISEATGSPPVQPNGSPTPAQPGTPGQLSLEELAAPGRARSAPQQLPPEKPLYTSASIARFMQDKLMGKWKGREADADLIEQDIFLAQHEGRIQV